MLSFHPFFIRYRILAAITRNFFRFFSTRQLQIYSFVGLLLLFFFPVPLNSWKNWCFPALALLTSSFVSHSVWLLWILYFIGGDRVFRLRCWMNEYQMIMNTNANANAKSVIAFHVLLWHEIYGRFNRWKWFIANIYSHKYLYRSRYITTLHVLILPNTVRPLARSIAFLLCYFGIFFLFHAKSYLDSWIYDFRAAQRVVCHFIRWFFNTGSTLLFQRNNDFEHNVKCYHYLNIWFF